MKVGTIFPYGRCFYFGRMRNWIFKQKKVRFVSGVRLAWECKMPGEMAGYDDSPHSALRSMRVMSQLFTNRFNSGATVSLHIEKVVVLCEYWQ